jgi:hypothetical protein
LLDLFHEIRWINGLEIARNADVFLKPPQPLCVIRWCLIPWVVA